MSLFALIVTMLLAMNDASRYRKNSRGQMGFKWSRKQNAKGMNVQNHPFNAEPEETNPNGFASENAPNYENNPNDPEVPEPTLDPEVDEAPPVVIDMEPFTTMDDIQDEHEGAIMDCLYNKCHDIFNDCFDDEQCKEFLRDWQETQSLPDQCLTSFASSANNEPMEENQDENQECEYNELFWNTYHCGVENDCYNDQSVLAAPHESVLSAPTNDDDDNTSKSSSSASFNYRLLLTIGIASCVVIIILIYVLRRMYNSLHNKWTENNEYKYEKTNDDLPGIEQDDDDAVYGEDDMLQKGNGSIGVTYNGIINDDSSISDDEELQTPPNHQNSDIHIDNNDSSKHNQQKETEELIEETTYLSTPTQPL